MGADRINDNIAINCFDSILKNKLKDNYSFKIVVTDDDEDIINFLNKNKVKYISAKEANNFMSLVKKNEYDWLINLWGHKIFKDDFLKLFKNNLNLHPSYLPYGRGKDCAVWTIVYNYKAGASIHKMTKDLDCGPVYYQEEIDYSFPTTGIELYEKCCKLCLTIFKKYWNRILKGNIIPKKQKQGDYKTFFRKELLENNLENLDNNLIARNFVLKSLSQDFNSNFSLKIEFNGKKYLYKSLIEEVK